MSTRVGSRRLSDKVEQQMTPMIDIVFQLLIFFILSFRISQQEGEFSIKMPLARSDTLSAPDPLLPPLRVRLLAAADGTLSGIRLGERSLPDFSALRRELVQIVGSNTGPSSVAAQSEVELECDYQLRYEYVIRAVTAVSGKLANGHVVRLVEKIKFAPPRRPGE